MVRLLAIGGHRVESAVVACSPGRLLYSDAVL